MDTSVILNLGNKWRWIVSFKSLSVYPQTKETPLPDEQETVWASVSVWTFCRRTKSFSPTENRKKEFSVVRTSRSQVTIPTEPPRCMMLPRLYKFLSLFSPDTFDTTNTEPHIYVIPCTRVLQQLTGSQPVKKFPSLYGTQRLVTAFTRAKELYIS
jgi:hypothetical protein